MKAMENEYFETCSVILNNDTKRFIERISYEAFCSLNGTEQEYCERLETLIRNHVEKEEYEIAEGLKFCIEFIKK